MKHKFLSALLALVMALTMLPASALAAGNPQEDGIPDGSAANPYTISPGTDGAAVGIVFNEAGIYQLTADVTASHVYAATNFNKGPVTLDLNGHKLTLTGENGIIYADGDLKDLTIMSSAAGGTIIPTRQWAAVQITGESNKVTIGQNVTIDGTSITGRDVFAILIGKNATGTPELNLNGCTIKDANGVTVNGLCTGAPRITLNGATIEATHSDTNTEPVAIYQAGPANSSDVNIANSTITASGTNGTGIEVRAGKLTLSNSTVTGGSGELAVSANGNGSTTKNAAVAVSQHTTALDIDVKLSGNVVLNGTAAVSVANPQSNTTGKVTVEIPSGIYNGAVVKNENAANATLTITGGTFAADVSEFVPQDTYQCTQSGGKWVVGPYIPKHSVTFNLATGVILTDVTNAEAVTGTPEKYTVTDAAQPVTFRLTAPENAAIDTVKAGDTTLTDASGVYTIPANLTADVTVTVMVKTTVAEAATLTVALPNETEATAINTALGKTVDALQKNIAITGLHVTGTSNYVQKFTGFNGTDTAEQQGNYIALKLTASDGKTAIQVKSNNGDAQGYKTLDSDGLLVHRISVDTATGKINPIHVKLGQAEYDINLTGITLGLPPMPEPEAPAAGATTVTNDLSANTAVAADIKNTIANVSTGKVDDTGEGTPDANASEVTITFSGKTDSAADIKSGTVKLSADAVKALKNDSVNDQEAVRDVTVNAAVETNVADVVLPAGALKELDAAKSVAVSVEKKEAGDIGTSLSEDHKTLVGKAEVIADITVTQPGSGSGETEPFASTNLTGSDAITLRIKVSANKSYQVLYVDASTVTKVGAAQIPAGSETGGYYVEISAAHLSTYAVVDAEANKEALDKLGASNVPGEVKLTYKQTLTDAEKTMYYGGKLTISGLQANKTYLVTFDYGSAISGGRVPRAVVAVKADANGEATLSCQSNMKVTVHRPGDDNNLNAKKITAIFYDPTTDNQGVLVTNSNYITQVG